ERERLLPPAAEQRADRQSRRAAEDVPASDVDRALRVRVARQRRVDPVADDRRLARIEPEQRRADLVQRHTRALAVRPQVRRAERAGLAESLDAVVGGDPNDRRRQHADRPPTRHDVAAVDVGQVVAEDVDARDLQGPWSRYAGPGPRAWPYQRLA